MKNKAFSASGYQNLTRQLNTSTGISAMAAAMMMVAGSAQALPQGGVVAAGDASIAQSGKNLTVNQASDRTVINWEGFDINTDEATRFIQPSANSIALNRVTHSNAPSKILGSLSANGRVVLVNPKGVFFGAGSHVDVGSLIATTADTSTADFMKGKLQFKTAGDADAKIINEGTITAKQGGLVSLVAPGVENSGVIRANSGTVALGAGETVTFDFYGDELVSFAVDGKAGEGIDNSGAISATDGSVYMTANAASDIVNNTINTSGVIEATSVTKQGNVIILGGAGDVQVSGAVSVAGKGADARGGKVVVSGQNVTVSDATIDASGAAAGGQIEIGGGKHGAADYTTAGTVTVSKDASLVANSANGNAGDITLWSEKATHFTGDITAKGAIDGGFAEVSSRGLLGFYGAVDLKGETGKAGTLLLDPEEVFITAAGANDGQVTADGNVAVADGGALFTISASAVETALNNFANVIIEALNKIHVQADVDVSADAAALGNDLTLKADQILLNGNISLNDGDLNLFGNSINIGNAIDLGAGVLKALGLDGVSKALTVQTSTSSTINSTAATGDAVTIKANNLRHKGTIDTQANVLLQAPTMRIDGAVRTQDGQIVADAETGTMTLNNTGLLYSDKSDPSVLDGVIIKGGNVILNGDVDARGNIDVAANANVTTGATSSLVSRYRNVEISAGVDALIGGLVESGRSANPDFVEVVAGNKVTLASTAKVDGSGYAKLKAGVVDVAGELTSANTITIQASNKAILSGLLSGSILSSSTAGADTKLASHAPVVDVNSNTIGIDQGIDIATTGGTVNLAAISFKQGDIVIDKAVTLRGKGADKTRLNATGFSNGITLNGDADSVFLKNFTIRNATDNGLRIDAMGETISGLQLNGMDIRQNGKSGLAVTMGTTLASSGIADSHFDYNGVNGFTVEAGGTVNILNVRNSTFNYNTKNGLEVETVDTGLVVKSPKVFMPLETSSPVTETTAFSDAIEKLTLKLVPSELPELLKTPVKVFAKSGKLINAKFDATSMGLTQFSNNGLHGALITAADRVSFNNVAFVNNAVTGLALSDNINTPEDIKKISITNSKIHDNGVFGIFAQIQPYAPLDSLEIVGNDFAGNGDHVALGEDITLKAGDGSLRSLVTDSGDAVVDLVADNSYDRLVYVTEADNSWHASNLGFRHLYNTITEGVADASDTHTVNVGAGTYDEAVRVLNKDITLRGITGDASDVVIKPQTLTGVPTASGSPAYSWLNRSVVTVDNGNVKIADLTVDSSGIDGLLGTDERSVGIQAQNGGAIAIKDVVLEGGDFGIVVNDSSSSLMVMDTVGSAFNNFSDKAIAFFNGAMGGTSTDGRGFFFNGTKADELADPESSVNDADDNTTLGDIFFTTSFPPEPEPSTGTDTGTDGGTDTGTTGGETGAGGETGTDGGPITTPPVATTQSNIQALNEFLGNRFQELNNALLSFFGQTLGDGGSFTGNLNLSLSGGGAATAALSADQLGQLAPAAGGSSAGGTSEQCGNSYLAAGYSAEFEQTNCGTNGGGVADSSNRL